MVSFSQVSPPKHSIQLSSHRAFRILTRLWIKGWYISVPFHEVPRDVSLHHSVHTSWGLTGLQRPRNKITHRRRSCDTGGSERSSPSTVLPFSPDLSNSVPNSVLRSHAKFDVSTPSSILYIEPKLKLVSFVCFFFSPLQKFPGCLDLLLTWFCISILVSQTRSIPHAGYVHKVDVC